MATLVGQNQTYDHIWLYEVFGIRVRGAEHDTRLMHHALFPELPKDLPYMVKLHTSFAMDWKLLNKSEKKEA